MCDPFEIPKYEAASGEYFQDISSIPIVISDGKTPPISVKTYFKATCKNEEQ